MVLVLRQGTGLALSTSILPPGCSQKRSPAFMNTTSHAIDLYEVTEQGIRAVRVTPGPNRAGPPFYFTSLQYARMAFDRAFGAQKPRVAPRMSTSGPHVGGAA